MPTTQRYREAIKWVHLSSITEEINRTGQARLHRVVVNTAVASNLIVYDGPNVAADVVASIDCSTQGTYDYNDLLLNTGLTVSGTGAADVTVIYE